MVVETSVNRCGCVDCEDKTHEARHSALSAVSEAEVTRVMFTCCQCGQDHRIHE